MTALFKFPFCLTSSSKDPGPVFAERTPMTRYRALGGRPALESISESYTTSSRPSAAQKTCLLSCTHHMLRPFFCRYAAHIEHPHRHRCRRRRRRHQREKTNNMRTAWKGQREGQREGGRGGRTKSDCQGATKTSCVFAYGKTPDTEREVKRGERRSRTDASTQNGWHNSRG